MPRPPAQQYAGLSGSKSIKMADVSFRRNVEKLSHSCWSLSQTRLRREVCCATKLLTARRVRMKVLLAYFMCLCNLFAYKLVTGSSLSAECDSWPISHHREFVLEFARLWTVGKSRKTRSVPMQTRENMQTPQKGETEPRTFLLWSMTLISIDNCGGFASCLKGKSTTFHMDVQSMLMVIVINCSNKFLGLCYTDRGSKVLSGSHSRS